MLLSPDRATGNTPTIRPQKDQGVLDITLDVICTNSVELFTLNPGATVHYRTWKVGSIEMYSSMVYIYASCRLLIVTYNDAPRDSILTPGDIAKASSLFPVRKLNQKLRL